MTSNRSTALRGASAGAALTAAALAASALLLAMATSGCGSSDGPTGPSGPEGLALVFERDGTQVTRTVEIEAVYVYPAARQEHPDCDWYVDGVPGGEPSVGTVSQSNPAVYTAPATVPAAGYVEISAVSREDTTYAAAGTLSVAFTVRYVDAEQGVDQASGGSWPEPLRTITFALSEVAAGDTVHALPGTYDQAGGEGASYAIPSGVTLRGVSSDSCLISGSGSEYRLIELGGGARFEGFTVQNAGTDQIGILTAAGGAIVDVATEDPFDYAVIRVEGGARENAVLIEDCALVNGGSPYTERAFELYDGTRCVIRGCSVSGWQTGFYVESDSAPLIEGCSITDNYYGVTVLPGGGAVPPAPDLGGGARGSLGGNTISNNTAVGLVNFTTTDIWALDNAWTTDPPTEGPPFPCDYYNPAGGSVIWQR
jgi:hypothetical protein